MALRELVERLKDAVAPAAPAETEGYAKDSYPAGALVGSQQFPAGAVRPEELGRPDGTFQEPLGPQQDESRPASDG